MLRLAPCEAEFFTFYASKRGGRDKVTAYAAGMEMHPGRERGPHAQKKRPSGEYPLPAPDSTPATGKA